MSKEEIRLEINNILDGFSEEALREFLVLLKELTTPDEPA